MKVPDCFSCQKIYEQTKFRLLFLTSQIKADKKGATFVRKATIGKTLKHSAIMTCALVSLPSVAFARMQRALNFAWSLTPLLN